MYLDAVRQSADDFQGIKSLRNGNESSTTPSNYAYQHESELPVPNATTSQRLVRRHTTDAEERCKHCYCLKADCRDISASNTVYRSLEDGTQYCRNCRANNQYEKEIARLTTALRAKEKENETLKYDINALKFDLSKVLSKAFSAKLPEHGEADYARRLIALNGSIKCLLPDYFLGDSNHKLLDTSAERIVKALSNINPHGKHTVDRLTAVDICRIYEHVETRITFVRHIIALFLWVWIFRPMAFGLEEGMNNSCQAMQHLIMETGNYLKQDSHRL